MKHLQLLTVHIAVEESEAQRDWASKEGSRNANPENLALLLRTSCALLPFTMVSGSVRTNTSDFWSTACLGWWSLPLCHVQINALPGDPRCRNCIFLISGGIYQTGNKCTEYLYSGDDSKSQTLCLSIFCFFSLSFLPKLRFCRFANTCPILYWFKDSRWDPEYNLHF